MSKGVEPILVTRQEIVVLLRTKLTMAECLHVVVTMKYSELEFNQHNGSIVRKVPRDWSRGIHSVNKVPKPKFPHCTYCHQIRHQINECPFIENNVKQGFIEHFQNLNNQEPIKVGNHGHIELKGLYHERVKILDRLRKQIWRQNKMEMKVQTMADVILVFIAPILSLLHQNHIGITYA
jgi:hypothetical protein